MASNAYLTLKGQKQGPITGSNIQKGREGTILVHAVSHSVASPRDLATGLATGKRQYKPLVITKEVDRSSPLLYTALATNENLTSFVLQFVAPAVATAGAAGLEKLIYTITLTNANIASIDLRMADNLEPALAGIPMYEEIAFTYQKIQWTWADGGITAADDWQSPVA
jgi:type VI secretion system secreted protein Hcp